MSITEISRSLSIGGEGIIVYHGKRAWEERILHFLEIPEGQGELLHDASFGHPLLKYQFLSIDGDLLVAIEMDILSKIENDIEGLVVQGIEVLEEEIDLITIRIMFGDEVSTINYSGTGASLPGEEQIDSFF